MMRPKLHIVFLGVLIAGSSAFAAAPAGKITPPTVRANTIANAERLLSKRQFKFADAPEELNNPFAPRQLPSGEATKSARPGSDQAFLELLASQINPTGVLMLGDSSMLLFGEKKVKVGESLGIPFDNITYEVEVVHVDRTTFTVRFNKAEFTRSIKPVKAP